MKIKIDSSVGRRQYSKRLGAIEPVFGNISVNIDMNIFTLRGKKNEYPMANVLLGSQHRKVKK